MTLAFAGDIHFELHLSDLLDRPEGALGGVTRTLRAADLTMVNLESSITRRGAREPKDYHFRTSPAALDVLDRAGVDVIGLANNHSVDYGPVGLADTLRAARASPAPVVGIGRNAGRPTARTACRSAAPTSPSSPRAPSVSARSTRWAAGPGTPGIATAVEVRPRRLLRAVRSASRRDDVVVVYLHWGTERESCPGAKQRALTRALAAAGADVIVGSHAHVLQGSGWAGDTYVSYGLGNFLWYHNQQSESGVLEVRIDDGRVVGDGWVPARIETFGRPRVLTGRTARPRSPTGVRCAAAPVSLPAPRPEPTPLSARTRRSAGSPSRSTSRRPTPSRSARTRAPRRRPARMTPRGRGDPADRSIAAKR